MEQHEVITADGEILPPENYDIGNSLAVGLTRAEIDQQIATARRYPRSINVVTGKIKDLATLDEVSAEEAMYSLPRGGKTIEGPSARFAEIVAASYGNCRCAARVVHVDRVEKFVEAEGVFHDLETNQARAARVRRRISDSKGRVYNDDMIVMTGNAACSIALRNAILAGVPRAVWRSGYDAARQVIMGDIATLANRRADALKAFHRFGVTPEQVFAALGLKGEEDVTLDHLVTLRGMFAALKNSESTVEEMFSTRTTGKAFDKVSNPLADDDAKPAANAAPVEQKAATAAPAEQAKPEAPSEDKPSSDAQEAAQPAEKQEAPAEDKATPQKMDPVEIARARGRDAKASGMSRKASPPEYRDAARKAEFDAWVAGHDEAAK